MTEALAVLHSACMGWSHGLMYFALSAGAHQRWQGAGYGHRAGAQQTSANLHPSAQALVCHEGQHGRPHWHVVSVQYPGQR